MKKIVIDATCCIIRKDYRFLTGIGRTTLELIRALESYSDLPFHLELFSQRVKHDRLQRYHFKSKAHSLPLPVGHMADQLKTLFPIVETITGYDLLHLPANGGFCHKMDHTVLTVHDAFAYLPQFKNDFSEEGRLILRKQVKQCLRIITCSECSKHDLIEYTDLPESKITVIPWGYDKGMFYPQPAQDVQKRLKQKYHIDSPYLFSCSLAHRRKRALALIKEYLRIADDSYPYDLILAMKGDTPEIQQMSSAKNFHRIRFLADLADNELADLYRGATCMIFPSIYEGFGLPLLESMACGTPVLTTRVSSMPEVAGDAGIYIETLDDEEIGEKLQMLGRGDYDLNAASVAGLKRVAQFSWENCAMQTINIYRDVLGI